MSDTHSLTGAIRRSLYAIIDHYDAALEPPRHPSVRLPTKATPGERMRYVPRVIKEAPAPVNLHVLDVRRDTHSDLAHFARVVLMGVTGIDGQTIATPVDGDDPIALARFLITWAERLVACDPQEARGCDRDMAHHAAMLKAIALPDRPDGVSIGNCPLAVARDGVRVECGTRLRAHTGQDFIKCRGCEHEDTVGWWRTKLLGHRPEKVTAVELVDVLLLDLEMAVSADTVRQWFHRGKIERAGRDDKGRPLYDWADVVARLTTPKEARSA